MPEAVTDRPTKSHEYLFLLTKSARYYYDADAVREPVSEVSIKRAEYGWNCDRPSAKAGPDGIHTEKMGSRFVPVNGRNLRSVWTINPKPYTEAHFATFPTALVEPCVKAGSQKGDTVLDPFAGSGTTLAVARKLDRRPIGYELSEEYAIRARERLESTAPGDSLDGAEDPLTSAPKTSAGVKVEERAARKRADDRQLELL